MVQPVRIDRKINQGTTQAITLKRSHFPYPVFRDCEGYRKSCDRSPAPEADRVYQDYTGCTFSAALKMAPTGAPLGPVMTGAQLMVAVQSWVLHQMLKRDAPAPAEGGA